MKEKIINEIKKGHLVIMPTDTIYGIIADATNEKTIKKVYLAKERSFHKPLLILISNEKMLQELVIEIPSLVQKLIKKYWPGPLTILFKKSQKVSSLLTAGSDYVAIRMPRDNRLLEIMNQLNRPLISTSANISSHNPITNPSQIEPRMREKIDYILDEGTVNKEASTLIKVENNKIEILRDGQLSQQLAQENKEH